jgi:4-hydroxybenzoate polyprenyltransferase
MFAKLLVRFAPVISKAKSHIQLARYDKPIGGMLIYMPCVWGVVLGQPIFDVQQCTLVHEV